MYNLKLIYIFRIIFKYHSHICKLKDMLPNSEIKMEKFSARLLSSSVVGDCFNMKWQRIRVALTNVHGLHVIYILIL
jgi:hypothetical protein